VQTPLLTSYPLAPGDAVFMRHAKAGELAEHFPEYLLIRGDRIVERVPTYRGLGQAFY
jgi:D-serine deaminase-like pyridoxal phosphate-dependent protein